MQSPADRPLRVLVADPNPDVVFMLSTFLGFHGFDVFTATDGHEALRQVSTVRPDALILEVDLPGVDGLGVLDRLRTNLDDTPVLYLSTRDTIEDRVAGLVLGADDYITKPFSLEELTIRLRVVLRRTLSRSQSTRPAPLAFGDIELDEDTHAAWRAGKQVSLSPTEFALLRYFMINPRTVLSKQMILASVWHGDGCRHDNIVDVYVSALRRKIDADHDRRVIHTLRGVGFILRESRPSPGRVGRAGRNNGPDAGRCCLRNIGDSS